METGNINTDNRETDSFDLAILWRVFVRRWYIIIMAAILAGFGAGLFASLRYVPRYSASVSFLIRVESNFTSQYQSAGVNDTIVHTYEVALRHNKEFCQKLNEVAGTEEALGYTAETVSSMMKCEQILPNTPSLKITFTSPNPTAAYNLAEAMRTYANDELAERFTNLSAVDVFNIPEMPTTPVNSNPFLKMFILGFAAGALLIYAIFLLFALMDKTIHGESSMEEFSEYPILGIVPTFSGKRSGKSGKTSYRS